jgi:tRNA dimethylallyltransferase
MEKQKPKIIIVVGPTASGKSELAVRMAKKFNGEIISADSRQVYRGLDIGTGKVPGKWRKLNGKRRFIYKNIAHYCIDFVSPQKKFSAAEYKKCAARAIEDIANRGKTPIIAGGTGFYIDSVAYDLSIPEVAPSAKLRRQLEKKSAAELLTLLKKIDPERAETIDKKNPRRLIRAIEIAKALGRVPSLKKSSPYEILWLGMKPPPEILTKRIRKRLLSRMRQGMIKEARRLKKKLGWKRFYEFGLEYRFLADYLRQKITKKEFKEKLETAIRQYAKRQMTWFKKNKKIRWIKDENTAANYANSFLSAGTRPTWQKKS